MSRLIDVVIIVAIMALLFSAGFGYGYNYLLKIATNAQS